MAFQLIMLSGFLFATAGGLYGEGLKVECLLSALLGIIAIDGVVWDLIVGRNRSSFALKAIFVFGVLAKTFPIAMCVSTLTASGPTFPWGEQVLEDPFNACMGLAMPNLVIGLVLLPLCFARVAGSSWASAARLSEINDKNMEIFLVLVGVIKLTYWIAITEFNNPVFFLLRRFDSAFTFMPFLVGLNARRMRKAFWFWVFVFAFFLIASLLTGTRGKTFNPLAFFLAGLFLSFPTWRDRINFGMLVLAPTCVVLLLIGVYIGVARDIAGRSDLATAVSEGTMLRRLGNTDVTRSVSRSGGVLYGASRRLTSWPPLVVPTMTPKPVEYRGFGDIEEELVSALSIRIGRDIQDGRFYWPNIHLKPYGFAVHVDSRGMQTSSVELSYFVDGFTRGGWACAIWYCMIGCVLVVGVEWAARAWLASSSPAVFVLVLFVISNPLRDIGGLVYYGRLLILESFASAAVFLAVDYLFRSSRRGVAK